MNAPTTGTPAYTCLDYRREKLADPKHMSPAALAHARDCALCQAFAQRIDAMETRYADAMQVPVPEGLADRVILRARHKRRIAGGWRLAALAAAVLISLGVGLQWAPDNVLPNSAGAAEYAIRHVLHEPEAFHEGAHIDIDPSRLQQVMTSFGGEMQAPLGKVRYIKLCPIEGGGTGWHIVFETPEGLATLLLVPVEGGRDVSIDKRARDGFDAMVRPAGRGYYALVTNSPDATRKMDETLRTRVRWTKT